MKSLFGLQILVILMSSMLASGEATEQREWHAKGGHTLEAKALQVAEGKVQLERADGSKVVVPMEKFKEEDQEFLREHFALEDPGTDDSAAPDAPKVVPADDLPHPLGAVTAELACGQYHYYLYFPKSLQQGVKHPVLFVMSPGGGSAGASKRYQPGAERNQWIIAVSKESKNGFNESQSAIDAMINEVVDTLPIDKKRMYTSGFSGGSRMAFATAGKHLDIAGVISCGAGGNLGSAKQVSYGLCGSNCFNRTDMANSFKGFRNKDCILRYIPGKHIWANAEYCDDAATHLNGAFLIKNERKYPDALALYLHAVSKLIEEQAEANPMRAFMWTSFLADREVLPAHLEERHKELGADDLNQLYLKGLTGVRFFAEKQFGTISNSQWQSDPKVSAACLREAKKYVGTPWEEILTKMSEDAQKF